MRLEAGNLERLKSELFSLVNYLLFMFFKVFIFYLLGIQIKL